MAKNNGWWDLSLKGNTYEELNDSDLEHIANLIKEGFTSGEICKDEVE